jgi:hypothetical protein
LAVPRSQMSGGRDPRDRSNLSTPEGSLHTGECRGGPTIAERMAEPSPREMKIMLAVWTTTRNHLGVPATERTLSDLQ